MNFFGKYNKYIKKTNNLYGGSFSYEKCILRIKKEINMFLLPEEYNNIVLTEPGAGAGADAKIKLTFTRIKDNASIIIEFSTDYPFVKPNITINDMKINIGVWGPTFTMKKILELEEEYTKKVLILCHPRLVTGTFEPLVLNNHFFGFPEFQYFQKIFGKYNLTGIPKFDTVDILPGGTYQADAFSDEFINLHINDYDLVMIPDCGGPWYFLNTDSETIIYPDGKKEEKKFTIQEQNDNKTKLITLCIKLSKIVKQGGIIQFSKFIYEEQPCIIDGINYDNFSSALGSHLSQNGFKVTFETIDTNRVIVAIKQ